MGDFLINWVNSGIIESEQVLFHYPPYIMNVQSRNHPEQNNTVSKTVSLQPIEITKSNVSLTLDTNSPQLLSETASPEIVSYTIRWFGKLNDIKVTISPFNDNAKELDQATAMLSDVTKNKLEANPNPTNQDILEANKRQIIRNDQIQYANAA